MRHAGCLLAGMKSQVSSRAHLLYKYRCHCLLANVLCRFGIIEISPSCEPVQHLLLRHEWTDDSSEALSHREAAIIQSKLLKLKNECLSVQCAAWP